MFGLKEMAQGYVSHVEASLLKLDVNHNGLPDLAEAKHLVEEGVADLKILEEKITPSEIAILLNSFFPGRFNADEITKVESGINKVAGGLALAASLAPEIKSAL